MSATIFVHGYEDERHESQILRKSSFEHFCTDDCVKGRGRFYQGTMNRTKQGLPCQHWDSQVPHSHYRPPDVFPEVQNAENYCRNAGGEEPSPWCYTMDPTVRWQRCDIPVCGKCCCSISIRCMKYICVQNLALYYSPKSKLRAFTSIHSCVRKHQS